MHIAEVRAFYSQQGRLERCPGKIAVNFISYVRFSDRQVSGCLAEYIHLFCLSQSLKHL
jgi:hypothetical protein